MLKNILVLAGFVFAVAGITFWISFKKLVTRHGDKTLADIRPELMKKFKCAMICLVAALVLFIIGYIMGR